MKILKQNGYQFPDFKTSYLNCNFPINVFEFCSSCNVNARLKTITVCAYFNDILADPTIEEIKLDFNEGTVENLLSFLYLDRVENLAENARNLLVAANKVCLKFYLILKCSFFNF
jgi:hypothetical protein